MSEAPVTPAVSPLEELARLLEEEIEAHSGATDEYCWWCSADVHGLYASVEPHAPNCWLVRVRAALSTPSPPREDAQQFLISLNEMQEQTVKSWAADDRLWTTQDTVEMNLRTFARTILKFADALDEQEAKRKMFVRLQAANWHEARCAVELLIEKAAMPREDDLADAIRAYRSEVERLKVIGLNQYGEPSRGWTDPCGCHHTIETRHLSTLCPAHLANVAPAQTETP